MKCFYHPLVDATATCQRCGKFLCSHCSSIFTEDQPESTSPSGIVLNYLEGASYNRSSKKFSSIIREPVKC
jgi:hypothetical protein